jgi:uncharacterized protein YbjT (DUF2867 family)
MAHLLIIGASGGIGRQAVRIGLRDGHRVRGFSRGAGAMAVADPGFEPFAGDATDPAALARALQGIDAVILSVGVAPGLRRTFRPVHVFSESTRAVVAGMEAAGVRRLVAVTGFGAGDSRAALSLPERVAHRLALGHVYDDKTRQEALIRDSALDWLIVRPTILTNGRGTGRYRVLRSRAEWRNGLISRADVALFLVREAVAPTLSHEASVLAL